MITITRRLALQLRVVFRRTLGLTRGFGPAICFATGQDGIRVRVRSGGGAVEYHAEGRLPKKEMWLPFEFLADVEARKDDLVELEAGHDGHVTASWRDGDVPQCVRYDFIESSDVEDLPEAPKTLVENPPRLLGALHDAMDTAQNESTRYAVDHILLQSTGTIVATDGRQMLLQDGFSFPWNEGVLIPKTTVFGCKELGKHTVAISSTEDWVVIQVGPWMFWLQIGKDMRFPEVAQHVPKAEHASATLRIHPADTEFLVKSLRRLPSSEEFNYPVTVDLNGTVAIRARAEMQKEPTELVLSNSTCSDEPMRINTNRKYLARAVKLGFEEVYLYANNTPVMCQDETRCYVWAVLSPETAIPPAEDAVRIASTEVQGRNPNKVRAADPKPKRRTRTAMSQKKSNNGQGETVADAKSTTAEKADDSTVEILIEQAEALKASLREALTKTSELISGLKRHRKQSKLVASTLASLKKLQTVDV